MSALRVVRNTAISIVVIGVLLVGGGLAYTYFLGPDGSQSAAQEQTPEPAVDRDIKPTKPSANTVASASVSALTSPVAPGDNTSLTIKTVPTAKCTVVVSYGGVAAKDSGLSPKTADEFGIATWAWTVDGSAQLGTWPVKVTCGYNGRTAVVQADLVVSEASITIE